MCDAGYLFIFQVLTFEPTITINKKTMKKLLFVFVLGAFTACGGNNGSEGIRDSTSVTADTSANASGTSGAMGADTSSKMGADTGAMTTPH